MNQNEIEDVLAAVKVYLHKAIDAGEIRLALEKLEKVIGPIKWKPR